MAKEEGIEMDGVLKLRRQIFERFLRYGNGDGNIICRLDFFSFNANIFT